MNEIDLNNLSEPLDIEQVDFRIQSINKGGYATILAYKNARVDMDRLDDVCGPLGWQRDHKELKGNIYAGIGIKCENDWMWKWDAGAESYSDKEKGEASDSFKRAGFNWGIGRELYKYPVIQVKLLNNEFTVDGNRAKQTYQLKLKKWSWLCMWDDEEIGAICCFDQNNLTRFIYANSIESLEKFWNLYPERQKQNDFSLLIKSTKKQLTPKL